MFRRGAQNDGFFPDFVDVFLGYQPVLFSGFTEQFFEPPPSEDAHPPASRRFMNCLPEVVVTKEDLDADTTNGECAICLTDQTIGQIATRMPCGHLFCGGCIKHWLEKSNTCPVCRYEVETDDPRYEARRLQNMKGRKMRFRHRELETKSVVELRGLMRMLGISAEGCIEKSEIIKRIEDSDKVELMKTSTAQQIYSLTELLGMPLSSVRNLMQGLGVRIANPETRTKIDFIRALANSGRAIVSTDGASPEEIENLQRQLSSHHPGPPVGEDSDREPKLQRTSAASVRPTSQSSSSSSNRLTREELGVMRIPELKELLRLRGIPNEGFLEKKDLVDRLLE
jgi:hypothetical protein